MEQLPHHESYMDEYVKTMQSNEFRYYINLTEPKLLRPQQMIFQ